MDGKFDVFDQYGQFVGRIIPSGEGCGGSVLAFLAIAMLWIFGFLIYAFVSSTIEGFKALGRGEIGKAALFLGIPAIMVCLVLSLPSAMVVSYVAEERTVELGAQEFDQLFPTGNLLRIAKLGDHLQLADHPACTPDCSQWLFNEYEVTNTTDRLYLQLSFSDMMGGLERISLGPNEKARFFCPVSRPLWGENSPRLYIYWNGDALEYRNETIDLP